VFTPRKNPRRIAAVSENRGDMDTMQTLCERRKDGEKNRAIWSRLRLFWRFQLAGWAAFVPLTFPLKVVLASTILRALLLSFIRDGSSFALTLGNRKLPSFPCGGRGQTMEAIVLMTDSGTARVISAGSQPKCSVPKEIESSRLW
jgi:hypothetical protein